MTNKWSDRVIEGVEETVDLLNYMLAERGQLYGTIIYLMQSLEKDKLTMPPVEAMKEYHDSFYVAFGKNEDDTFFVSIKPREVEDDNEDS